MGILKNEKGDPMIEFKGQIKALEPMTVALPDMVDEKHKNKILPFIVAPDGQKISYFPGGSFRGVLRHAGAKGIARYLEKNGKKVSLDKWLEWASGWNDSKADDGDDGDKGAILPSEISDIRKSDPFTSLFGKWGVAGRLSVGHLFPAFGESGELLATTFLSGFGARVIPFDRDETLSGLFDEEDVKEFYVDLDKDGERSRERQEIVKEQKDIRKKLKEGVVTKEESEERMKELRKAQEELEGKSAFRQPFGLNRSFECFAPGSIFDQRIRLTRETDLEIGAFLYCLRELAKEPVIGGHRASGMGQFSGSWNVTLIDSETLSRIPMGEVSMDMGSFSIPKEFEKKMDAFSVWMGSLLKG